MKIGCCISLKHVSRAIKLGYDFIELSATEIMRIDAKDWDNVKNDLLSLDIEIIGFNDFCNESLPIIGPNVNYNELIEYVRLVIQRGSDLNCSNIGIGAPKARILPDGYSIALADSQMKRFLKEAASIAEAYNITILYEPMNPHACNYGNSTAEIYDLVNALDLPNLKIVWDVFHSVNSSETKDEIAQYFDRVGHVHICSWDKELNRYYLFEKDANYLEELMMFLKNFNHIQTVSIEGNDTNFEIDGEQSLTMYRNLSF